jgi:hypothetical protein
MFVELGVGARLTLLLVLVFSADPQLENWRTIA